jgi:flagellum-specific peptidoglycan hydrolase FlgJ
MGEKVLGNQSGGLEITTHEEDKNGNRYKTRAKFRMFDSIEDMVNFHV